MLSLLLAVMTPQAAVAPPSSPAGNDIVVTARLRRAARTIAQRVDTVLPPLSLDRPLPRFTTAICPGVMGMTRDSAQAVVDRIGIVADDIGLAVAAPGCDPNLLVIVTADSKATVRRLVARRTANFRGQTLADIRRILAEPGQARAWTEAETRSRDGDPMVVSPDAPPELAVQGSSRIVNGFRRDIVSAIVVIDAQAVPGRDPVQIADYAAMRGLADARPGRLEAQLSVLSAFTAGRDAPATLTPLDRGILRGLYSGQGNVSSAAKRATIVREILREDEAPGE